MNLNKSDLKKLYKHHKAELEAEADLIYDKRLVQVCDLERKEILSRPEDFGNKKFVTEEFTKTFLLTSKNYVKRMHIELRLFKKAMAGKYGYDYNTHDIDYKTGEIKPKKNIEGFK